MIPALLSHIQVQRLGWALLHFLWQGTAIIFVYALLRRALTRCLTSHGRYILACSTLAAMVVSPAITFVLISDSNGGPVWTISLADSRRLLDGIVVLWLLGVVGFSLRLAGGWRFTARLRSIATPASAEWQQMLGRLAAALRVKESVRLLVSPLVEVPTVIGWLRPVILFPVDFLAGLPPGHIAALLAHELAHIRRYDYFTNILQSLAETALFYHPAVWWISQRIREEREQCCDDLAVAASGDVLIYAKALTWLELRRLPRFRPAVAANGGSLVDRIRRLIEPSHTASQQLPGPMAAWAMTLLWLAGAAVAGIHAAQTPLPVARLAIPAAPVLHPATPAPVPPASSADSLTPLNAVVYAAQKTLLYDPVFPMPPVPQRAPAPVVVAENPPLIASARIEDSGALSSILRASPIHSNPSPAETPVQPADAPLPDLRPAPRLVQVDVVARDWNSPARGLTKDSFTVFDNGKPQPVAVFSATSALPSLTPVRLAEGAVSNRLDSDSDGAAPANATIVLVDLRNTPAADLPFAVQRLKEVLETRRRHHANAERLGIYAWAPGGALEVPQELTTDGDCLIRAVKRLQAKSFGHSGAEEAGALPMNTGDVMEAIARHLAGVSGRRNLIWITEGPPDLNPHTAVIARALTDQNVSLYAVDAHGLIGAAEPNVLRLPFESARYLVPNGGFTNGLQMMSTLAEATGGMIFEGTTAVPDAIRGALDDAATGYTIGFYAQPGDEAAWHRLKLEVNRPGVQLRYRTRYFVPGAAAPENESMLAELLKDPLNATGVRLTAQSAPDPSRPGYRHVSVSVDLHDLQLQNHDNAWFGGIDVSFAVEGAPEAHRIRGRLNIPGDKLAVALENGLSVNDSIAVGARMAQLRIVAQDQLTGIAGTLTIPFPDR